MKIEKDSNKTLIKKLYYGGFVEGIYVVFGATIFIFFSGPVSRGGLFILLLGITLAIMRGQIKLALEIRELKKQ